MPRASTLTLSDGHNDSGSGEIAFGLYVHWPYCLAKCPYCDFNSHVAETIDQGAWRAAYLAELDTMAELIGPRRLSTIFFGGGTPSLMDPDTVAAVIAAARGHWPQEDAVEITLEANPTSVESTRLKSYAAAGVNRVSLGIQALDDDALGFLGRTHGADEALAALAAAKASFARVNADMIYARPGQTEVAWRAELRRLMDEGLDHLSLYQLTIERGTPFFGQHARGAFALPGEGAAARLYEATAEELAAGGLAAYEISNYARPGAECRHNLIYWRYGEYAGIGPGAHGRLRIAGSVRARCNLRRPNDWLSAVAEGGDGSDDEHSLDPETIIDEMLMMGLRLAEGVREDTFQAMTGLGFDEALDRSALTRLSEGGFVTIRDGRLYATEAGRLRLDAVLAALLARPSPANP